MNPPNLLTLTRVLLIPLLVVLILTPFRGREVITFSLFLLAVLTDMLDGFWARRKQQTTLLGQILDPTADKLLIVSVLICLVGTGAVKAWMAVIIIGRELAVAGFRAVASSRGIHISASPLGKTKMILEAVTISLLLLGPGHLKGLYVLGQVGLWLVVAAAVVSAAEYYFKYSARVLAGRS